MRSLHSLDRVDVTFDDDHAVADAGLVLPATLAQHLGLRQLIDVRVDLGDSAGTRQCGAQGDDVDPFGVGGRRLHRRRRRAAGGRHRRSCWVTTCWRPRRWARSCAASPGAHARQLDRVSGELLARAWTAGAGPGDQPVTIDVDSTICETYGLAKQGGVFGHTKVRGYHPLLAVDRRHR